MTVETKPNEEKKKERRQRQISHRVTSPRAEAGEDLPALAAVAIATTRCWSDSGT